MENLINTAAAEGDFTPAQVSKEVAQSYAYVPMPHTILVLKPEVSQKTKAGLIKSDTQIADELKKMDHAFAVLAVGAGVAELGIGANSRVVVQRFTATNLPSPVEGFDVVLVRVHDILAFDKTATTV